MNPKDIVVEQVEGARWVVVHGPVDPASPPMANVVITPELPPYASPQMAAAWRDRLAAILAQHCHRCDAVADTPPEVKTGPPGRTYLARNPLRHTPDCPCSDEAMDELEVACSPFGTIEPPDMSDEAIDRLGAHLRRVNTQLRATHAATDPEGNTR